VLRWRVAEMTNEDNAMTQETKPRYIVVATQTRPWSIVAGELIAHDRKGQSVTLRNARMIVYYSEDAHGLYGICARGPGEHARVSPPVDEADVSGYEQILTASADARRAIEAEPWH
jgi:hypothetical protein